MTSAKTTFTIDDRSTTVVSLAGIAVGLAIVSSKGEPYVPKKITTPGQLLAFAGDAKPAYGTTLYAAQMYLEEGNSLWATRAASAAALCGAALVRGKVSDVPTTAQPTFPSECLRVKPLAGLAWNDIEAYTFPTYLTNRVYSDPDVDITEDADGTQKYIDVLDLTPFSVGQRISVVDADADIDDLNSETNSDGENLPYYTIQEVSEVEVSKEAIILSANVSAAEGTELKYLDEDTSTPTSFVPAIVIRETATNTNTLIVSDSDLIDPEIPLIVGSTQVNLVSKETIEINTKRLVLDKLVTATKGQKVFIIQTYEYEDLDAFLVYLTPGKWADDVSIGIEKSISYSNAFWLVVYDSGVEVERWEVTREHYVNGFQRQMYIEDVVNRKSNYVRVLNNPNCEHNPTAISNAYWQRLAEDQFRSVGSNVVEDVLVGHNQLFVDTVSTLIIGTRIKLEQKGVQGEEYKITAISGNSITLDRKATKEYKLSNGAISIVAFSASYQDAANGIINGVKYYPFVELTKVYPDNNVGDTLTISSVVGKLVDTGTGHTLGGNDGNAVTVAELITAAKTLSSRGKTPINAIGDGGVASAAYAQALKLVSDSQEDCHVFLSNDLENELGNNALADTIAYRQALGINDRTCSLFTGWVQRFDEVNQLYVWMPPSQVGINAQSYVTREKTIFTPAAGWVNGNVTGLNVAYEWSEGEMDDLVAAQINPIKYENGSIVIWGNETLQSRPSPLQLRSVNFLIIAVQVAVRSLNEYRLFDFNNESTWGPLEGAVEAYLRDEVKAKGGVYDYKVVMDPTDTEIDNRKAPLWIGLQPTLDIQTIPTTIAIFSKSSEITV